jgi:hypothetical protein
MRRFMVCTPYQIRVVKSRMRWAGHVARTGGKVYAQKALVRKPEVKKATWKSYAQVEKYY